MVGAAMAVIDTASCIISLSSGLDGFFTLGKPAQS